MKLKRANFMFVTARIAAMASCLWVAACSQQQAPAGGSAATASTPPAIQYEAHIPAGGKAPAAATLQNPVAGDPAAAKTGATLFTAMNCDGCHGGDASGWVGPSLTDGRWRYGGADEEIFSSIYFGRPKGMPAFGGTIGEAAVWNLVTYLKSLPAPANVPTESWEDQ